MRQNPVPYILLGSPPIGPLAADLLLASDYPPQAVITDTSLTTDELIQAVLDHKAGFILVVGYGKMLKPRLFDEVCGQILNLHPSLLPAYRGPAPVVQAILDGATETGITLLELDSKMDHGPILAQERYPLVGKETPDELYQILIQKGVHLFLELIDQYLDEQLELTAQEDDEATYTAKIEKGDGLLNLSDDIYQLERQIRAFAGWPGSWIMDQDKKLLIKQAHIKDQKLEFDLVQPQNGKVMSLTAYAAGRRLSPQALYTQWFPHQEIENEIGQSIDTAV